MRVLNKCTCHVLIEYRSTRDKCAVCGVRTPLNRVSRALLHYVIPTHLTSYVTLTGYRGRDTTPGGNI